MNAVDKKPPHDGQDMLEAPAEADGQLFDEPVSSRNNRIKARLRHTVQSTRMWSRALWSCRSRRHRVAIAPSGTAWDAASNLRAWTLAPALRRLGWRVLMLAPDASLAERQQVLRLWRPDVLLLQQSRHPLNRPQLYPGVTCVFDQDDADYLDERARDAIVACCAGSARVIAGSRAVGGMLVRHNPEVDVIWTSTPASAAPPRRRPSQRQPIVAWAHASPFDYPAEMAYVQKVMKAVARVRPGTEFWLFGCGDDDPRVAAWFWPLEVAGIRCQAWPYMPYRRYLEVVANAAVGLQPVCVDESPYSEGKSFGKVLAYLAGEVPVVASDNVDHPLFFESGRNGFLVRDEVDCAQAVVTLLSDRHLRDDVASVALQDFRARLSTSAAAARVSVVLREAIGAQRLRGGRFDARADDGDGDGEGEGGVENGFDPSAAELGGEVASPPGARPTTASPARVPLGVVDARADDGEGEGKGEDGFERSTVPPEIDEVSAAAMPEPARRGRLAPLHDFVASIRASSATR